MDSNCPICLFPISTEKLNKLSCTHFICTECINELIKHSNLCPICKKEFLNYQNSKNEIISLSKENLTKIEEEKKNFYKEENFDCITRFDINRQLNILEKSCEDIKFKFNQLGNSASEKELYTLTKIYKTIDETFSLINEEEYDAKIVQQNITNMIMEIKNLKTRKYRYEYLEKDEDEDYYENFEDDYIDPKLNHGIKCKYDIEFVTNNNKKKKKKKKHK